MRSLSDSNQRRCFGSFVSLRNTFVGAGLLGSVLSSAVAVAAGPALAVDEPSTTSVTQSTTTTVTTNSPPEDVAPLPPPPSVPQTVLAPVAPLAAPQTVLVPAAPPTAQAVVVPATPPPTAGFSGGFQGPVYFNGPVWIIPAQPGMPPSLPQQLPPPPVYVQPPRLAQPVQAIAPRPYVRPLVRPVVRKQSRGPVFSMGVRFTNLGIESQEVFGEKPSLWGGGVQLRFRNQGHWGFELALDALKATVAEGAFQRTSYPFTFSPMLYLFKNRPETRFNLFATAGFGLMGSDVTLYEGTRQERGQQFWEVLGQAGGGLELRFSRLAISADLRAIGMLLDQGSEPGQFYDGVDSGPVSPSSIGYKANLAAMYWF